MGVTAARDGNPCRARPSREAGPAKYVRAYAKGQKNDFRDAEAIAEAVQRPPRSSCPRCTRSRPSLMRQGIRDQRSNSGREHSSGSQPNELRKAKSTRGTPSMRAIVSTMEGRSSSDVRSDISPHSARDVRAASGLMPIGKLMRTPSISVRPAARCRSPSWPSVQLSGRRPPGVQNRSG
jgi:hypothetical protein